jgi:hypothetical protein
MHIQNHSQFESYGIWNFEKLKICNKILKFQKSFTTHKWCVIYMTSKAKVVFYDTKQNHKIINIFSYNLKLG